MNSIINLSLMLLEIIFLFIIISKTYKDYKNKGLYILIIIFTIISNIFIVKRIELFTLKINTGLILNLMIYIISNIIIQKKGPYEISNILICIFITTLFTYLILTISGIINPSIYNEHFNRLYNNIFEFNIRSYLASLTSLFIGLVINSQIYYQIKKEKNKVWISNTLSIIVSQFIESIIFIILMYIFELEANEIIYLIVCRYIIKVIIGILSNQLQIKLSKID